MKKVFGAIAGLVFALFGFGVIALVMSLTYGGLQRIFPNNFGNQMWGLVIFDIAIIAWALAFAFKSYSLGQYAAAGAGFLVGFAGTAMMIYAEVTLSAQQLTGGNADTAEIGQWMIYAFIIGSLVHVALLWMHHAADPDLAQQISSGIAQGQIRDKARVAAEHQLEVEAEELARDITAEAVAKARRDLHIPRSRTVIDVPALPVDDSLYVPSNGYPVPYPTRETAPSFLRNPAGWFKSKFGGKRNDAARTYERTATPLSHSMSFSSDGEYTIAWRETRDGRRVRQWCELCRIEGKTIWASPDPCEHVMRAKVQQVLSPDEATNMLEEIIVHGKDPHSDYALPCGHTAGERWNKEQQVHECTVCGAVRDEEKRAADEPPHPVHLEPKADQEGADKQKAPFQPE